MMMEKNHDILSACHVPGIEVSSLSLLYEVCIIYYIAVFMYDIYMRVWVCMYLYHLIPTTT